MSILIFDSFIVYFIWHYRAC